MARETYEQRESRLSIRLDRSLKEWVTEFAESCNVSVSSLLREYLEHLRLVHGDEGTSEVGVKQI